MVDPMLFTLLQIFLTIALLLFLISIQQFLFSKPHPLFERKRMFYRIMVVIINFLQIFDLMFKYLYLQNNQDSLIMLLYIDWIISNVIKSVLIFATAITTVGFMFQKKEKETPALLSWFYFFILISFNLSLYISSVLALATNRAFFWHVHYLVTAVELLAGTVVVIIIIMDVLWFLLKELILAYRLEENAMKIEQSRSASGSKVDLQAKAIMRAAFCKIVLMQAGLIAFAIQTSFDIPNRIRNLDAERNSSVFKPFFDTQGTLGAEFARHSFVALLLMGWLAVFTCEIEPEMVIGGLLGRRDATVKSIDRRDAEEWEKTVRVTRDAKANATNSTFLSTLKRGATLPSLFSLVEPKDEPEQRDQVASVTEE